MGPEDLIASTEVFARLKTAVKQKIVDRVGMGITTERPQRCLARLWASGLSLRAVWADVGPRVVLPHLSVYGVQLRFGR